jgi:hypothetical protein
MNMTHIVALIEPKRAANGRTTLDVHSQTRLGAKREANNEFFN